MPRATDDERPPVWVGHVALPVHDLEKSAEFWRGLGLRLIDREAEVAIFELRGGTHLVMLRSEQGVAANAPAPFDLMVDDVDAVRKELDERGLRPSEIHPTPFHRSFTVVDPNGYVVTFNSSHVGGRPV
jgi:catechol 2,3-dioxygenase-like lactoylglutathione lyase family enzyme